MRKTILITILSSVFLSAAGQNKTTTSQEQLWLGYFNQTRFSDHWGTWTDLHLRTRDDLFHELNQSIVRVGLTCYLTDRSKLTAGYAWVNNFPGENHKYVNQTEHRLWQQWQWHTVYPRVRTMQWIRLEERYRRKIANDSTLGDGYNFSYRVRYNLFLQVPLHNEGKPKKGGFSFILNDEIHINFGKNIVYNYFDQNRFFIGLAWHVNEHDNLQFGYMNIFQQLPAGNQYRNNHDLRLFFFQNLDLRKGKR